MYGRRAWLEAKRDGAIFLTFPAQLIKAAQMDTEAARLLAGEQNMFSARIEQLRREIEGPES